MAGSGPEALSPSRPSASRFARDRDAGEEQRATTLELFYDLVFVFAVTQVSHLLLDDLSWEGAGEAALVLLVVWWAWNYTTWVTNELDPDSPVVRLLLIGIMLATLLMAVAIPDAFGSKGLLFACSYVAIQVGRHLFLTFVSARAGTIERERAAHILVWFFAAGSFWIAGALVEDEARAALWLVALAIDYLAPVFLYRVPGRPKLAPETWDVETAHFAERFQLFVIIALGESIVLIGATTSDLDIDAARLTALALAFAGTAALWWLYFDYVAPIAQRRLELAPNTDGAGAGRLHVPPRRSDRRHHRVGGRRRARHRPSDGRAARRRRSPCSWPGRRSICSATCSSACGWPARCHGSGWSER